MILGPICSPERAKLVLPKLEFPSPSYLIFSLIASSGFQGLKLESVKWVSWRVERKATIILQNCNWFFNVAMRMVRITPAPGWPIRLPTHVLT